MKTNRFFTAILALVLCVNFISCGDDNERVESNTTDYVSDILPMETGVFYFDGLGNYTNYGKECWFNIENQGKISVLEEGEDINVIFEYSDEGDTDTYRKGVKQGNEIDWYGNHGYAPNYRDIQFLFYFALTTNGKKALVKHSYGTQNKDFYYLK